MSQLLYSSGVQSPLALQCLVTPAVEQAMQTVASAPQANVVYYVLGAWYLLLPESCTCC